MNRTFSSLSFFNYRLWFAGALVSNTGTWMQRVAQDWLVLTVLTKDSGVAVGVTTALQFLPFLLLGPWAGLLADRVNHRRLLVMTQAAGGALSVALGTMVLLGHVQLWHVYGFAFALGLVAALDGPVRQTFVSDLVPPSRLTNAVGLNSASFNAARLVGPGIAGLLIAAVGSGWVFVLNGLTYVATIAALLTMRPQEFQPVERLERSPGQVVEGFRFVRRRADIMVVLVIVSVVSMFGLNFQLTSAMMARIEFGRGPSEYGILGSILAIGSLFGAVLASRREVVRVRLVIGAAALFAIATALTALAPTYWIYALATIPVGFSALTMLTSANAFVQTTTTAQMRGRVMALYMMVLLGSTPVGSPVVGWIGEHLGPRWSIGVGSITALAVATVAALWSIRHWSLDVSLHVHRPLLRIAYPEEQALEASR